MTRIETTVEFPHGIPCKNDVLGTEHTILIDSHEGIVSFPNIPSNYKESLPIRKRLIQPNNGNMEVAFYKTLDWGNYSDSGLSCMKRCIIWFPCNSVDYKKMGDEIGKNISGYFENFILFLEIYLKKAFDSYPTCGSSAENLTRYWLWEKDGKMMDARNPTISFSVNLVSEEFFASKDIIKEALSYSNKGFEPNLTYKLLRDSIFHKNRKDFRRAILDSSTAIEIALTERIKDELSTRNINDENLTDSFLKKYHSLRGRIELLKTLNVKLPRSKKDYDEFSNMRNRSIHAGYISNHSEAEKAVELAIDTLNTFSKLYT
jgi:hypothetical protein